MLLLKCVCTIILVSLTILYIYADNNRINHYHYPISSKDDMIYFKPFPNEKQIIIRDEEPKFFTDDESLCYDQYPQNLPKHWTE